MSEKLKRGNHALCNAPEIIVEMIRKTSGQMASNISIDTDRLCTHWAIVLSLEIELEIA